MANWELLSTATDEQLKMFTDEHPKRASYHLSLA
jgi:hypothetical protein